MGVDRHDSENESYTEIEDVTVGNPTKATDHNDLKANADVVAESAVMYRSPPGTYNDATVNAEKTGGAIVTVWDVVQEGAGALILNPTDLPFDKNDAGQMSLYDRRVDVSLMWVATNTEANVTKFLPAHEYEDGFNSHSANDHALTVYRGQEDMKLWTGPGQAAYNTGDYWGQASYLTANAGTCYVWLDTDDDKLYLRFENGTANAAWFAYSIALTLHSRTAHYTP